MTNWRGPGGSGRTTRRLRLRPWRDPRLITGLLLVLGSTILGARLAAAGDDSVEYWAVRSAVTVGDRVSQDELEPVRVRLSGAAADSYIRADEEFPAALADLVWAHPMEAGSLVSKRSLVTEDGIARAQLPLSVTAGSAPADLARGDLVDVWVGPGPGDQTGVGTVRVLQAVRVLQSGDDAAAAGGSLAQTVLVDVDGSLLGTGVIGTVAAGHVTLVRVS